MNTYDKIKLPPLPEWSKMDNLNGLVPSEIRQHLTEYAIAAVEAERDHILSCIEAEFNIATSKYLDSLDHYWDGAANAFHKAKQIVKGEN